MTEKEHFFLASASVKNCTDQQSVFVYGPPSLSPREDIHVTNEKCSNHLTVKVDTFDITFKAAYPNIFSVTCNNENCRFNLVENSIQLESCLFS